MGEIPVYAICCSNMLSKRDGDSNTSMDRGDVKRVYLNPRTRPYYLRRCKRVRPTDIQSLPDELLSDILARLPADHIHDVARLVCLRWYHIVRSSQFVSAQIQHSTYGLITSYTQVGAPNYQVLITATEGGQIKTREFSYRCRMGLYGSCNGLAVDYNFNAKLLYILNLATKQELVLPSCSKHFLELNNCGIAYAAASREYKVILPFENVGDSSSAPSLAILSVGVDESWRDVPVKHLSGIYRFLLSKKPLTTEGSIHWVIQGMVRVLTLDVETETFTMSRIPLPGDCYKRSYFLPTGRFLSFLFTRGDLSWEVWGMGALDREWSKVLPNIKLGAHKWRLQQQFGCGKDIVSRLIPLGWVKYPEMLALGFTGTGRTCVFFNLEMGGFDSIEIPKSLSGFSCHVHMNNLAWYG